MVTIQNKEQHDCYNEQCKGNPEEEQRSNEDQDHGKTEQQTIKMVCIRDLSMVCILLLHTWGITHLLNICIVTIQNKEQHDCYNEQ